MAQFLKHNYITFTTSNGICKLGPEAINVTKMKGFAYNIPYRFALGSDCQKASLRHSFHACVLAGFH